MYFEEDYTRPSCETDHEDVFRDLPLSFVIQELLARWPLPVPVRALALIFAAASLNTRECVTKFAQTDLGFVNRLTSVFLERCQVDLSDHRFSPLIVGALRVRTRVCAGCVNSSPTPVRRVVSSAVSNLFRVQAARPPNHPCLTVCSNPQPAGAGVCGVWFFFLSLPFVLSLQGRRKSFFRSAGLSTLLFGFSLCKAVERASSG